MAMHPDSPQRDRASWTHTMTARTTASLLVALAALLATVLPAAATSSAGATGNPQAIALYRAAANKTNSLRAYVILQTGYVRFDDAVGSPSELSWAWGSDQWQPGYFRASERMVLVQTKGRTDWILDTLTPLRGHCDGTCRHVFPIEMFITRGGAFAGLALSGSRAPCYKHEALSRVPYGVGTRWWSAYGRFAPLVRAGAQATITARYPDGTQQRTEVDTVGIVSHLFEHASFRDTPAGKLRGYTFHQEIRVLARAPSVPELDICS
jgi:hypothetical protein